MPFPPLRVELKTLHLNEPFRISHGTSTERTVLRLYCGDAVGEAPFVPYYPEDLNETLEWLQKLNWGGAPTPLYGPRAGRLALDLLWHDFVGRQRKVPIFELWGLDAAKVPPGCRSLSIPQDLGQFAEKVAEAANRFPLLKLKMGSGNVDFDEALAMVARGAAPHAMMFADVNGGWTVDDAVKMIPKLAGLNFEFVEQPVHHDGGRDSWRELRSKLPSESLPLYADESAQTVEDVLPLSGLVDGVNVKLLKAGSLPEARNMIRAARASKMKVILGCMIESAVGVTAASHLAPLVDWIDLDGHLYVANDDFEGLSYDENGGVLIPKRPGLGVSRVSR